MESNYVDRSNGLGTSDNFTTGGVLQPRHGRKLLVIRHGERIDFTFNPTHESWVLKSFGSDGTYKRMNINMPKTLPQRSDGYANYVDDTPLTEMGYLQAKITGRALKDALFKPTYVYSSCAYRSIQTAIGILKGLNTPEGKLKIQIEPGLFEWGAWFRSSKMPSFMKVDELIEHGYPLNPDYTPIIAAQNLSSAENLAEYYNRSYHVVKKILDRHPEDCIIALVAHGASLDACTRQLSGSPVRDQTNFYSILHQTPYLAVAYAREDPATFRWHLAEPPILPFQHQGNAAYDWRQLNI